MIVPVTRRAALAGFAATLVPLSRPSGQPREGQAAGPDIVLRAAPLPAKPGEPADRWSLDGRAAGPVLRVRHGEPVRATLRNDTTRPLSLHWHGVRGLASQDGVGGVSQPPVAPGGSFEYRFTPPDPGTFLIRPMTVGGSGEPAGRGVVGLLVVEEREPPEVDADYAMVVRDWLLELSGALSPFGRPEEAAAGGRLGNRLSVNGEDAPNRIALPPGSRVRIRLANGCNARIIRIRFDGLKAFVAAVDGQPTDTFEPLRASLPFAPGSRYDIVFDVPREAGTRGAISAMIGAGLPLVEVTAAGVPVPERPAIAALPPNRLLPPEIILQSALRRDLTITGGAARTGTGQVVAPSDPARIWAVNGVSGAVGAAPAFSARRGQPVVLAVTNATGFPQPVHLHGHVFRILHALDDGWEPYWLDTMQVAEGKTVRIAFLADNPGRWLLSSTVLERFDTGLWTSFEVT